MNSILKRFYPQDLHAERKFISTGYATLAIVPVRFMHTSRNSNERKANFKKELSNRRDIPVK